MVKNNQLKTSLIRCVFNQNSISIIMRNYITRYKTKINDLMQAADSMLQDLIASEKKLNLLLLLLCRILIGDRQFENLDSQS